VIELSRLNGHPIFVNADLLETVERIGELTVVTLTTGNMLEVTETPQAVRDAVVAYRRLILAPGS
jgi:uncharacterized protein YlzI (FlbEa/FlbD family)